MRFVKPGWLTHAGEKKDHEVYSCHVSPDGSRLATAGGDGHVRIWSTDAISHGDDPSKHRQLASLSHHSGTVHAVRFSGNGRYLASGADDKMVCVYNLDAGAPPPTFGSDQGERAVENWRMYRRLIGHENDVQDLGWSCDSSILVSVGLDSKVVVWSGSTFERLKTLAQHQSHVKGITFDPANKYFATASDDRSIKIYRFTSPPPNATAYDQTSNFTLEATITQPFSTSPLTTYFRRPSWGPDGENIAAANAVNGPVSSVAIIGRGKWENCDISLIGHEGPVEVCAFSPRLFGREPPPKDGTPAAYAPVTVVACAGQDRTVSVWNTSFPRPFFTSMEMSAKSISDLAWHPGGETVYATSLDGTIAAFVFQVGELGFPTPLSESTKVLDKYGVSRKTGIIESADALRLEEGSKAGELKDVEGRMGELMGDANTHTGALTNGDARPNGTSTPNGVHAEPVQAEPPPPKDPQQERAERLKQRVTITKDGKKRIAPLLLSSSNQSEMNLPKSQLQAAVRGGAASDEPAGRPLDLSTPYNGLPRGGLASLLVGTKRKFADMDDGEGEDRANERRVRDIREQTGAVPIVSNTADGLVPMTAAEAARRAADRAEIPDVLRPAVINPSLTVSSVRLAVPTVRHVILRPLDPTKPSTDGEAAPEGSSDDNSTIIFEARNATGPSRTGRAAEKDPTRITLSRRNQVLWQDFLHKAALLTTGNRNFWAVGCEDGSLHMWTPAGRRLLNALVLEAQPVILDCRGWYLLCITAVGQVYVWDVRKMSAVHPPVSLAPVLDVASMAQSQAGHLTSAPSLMFARLNGEGRVVVAMSNGDGYTYNPSMYIWQRLSDQWWAVGSQYWNTTDTSTATASSVAANGKAASHSILGDVKPENISSGIIPLLERNTTSLALVRGRAAALQRIVKALLSSEGYEGFESAVSIAHLENRVAAAYTLGAKDEFKVYLIMYAKRIGAEGLKGKVEELLRSLTGDLFSGGEEEAAGADEEVGEADGLQWGDSRNSIVGWKREDLLKEVVMVLGKHRDLQRVTVPYARVLGVLNSGVSGGTPAAAGREDVAMIMEG